MPLLLGAAVSFLLTPLVGRLAVRCGAVDHPDERRQHRHPTPTWGGLAIAAGFWTAVLTGSWPPNLPTVALLLASGVLLIVSAVDDQRGLPPLLRLTVHVLLSVLLWQFGGIRIYSISWPFSSAYLTLGKASLPLTVCWIVLIVNAMNWLDGMDGLSAGVGAVSSATLGVIAWAMGWREVALMGFALAGAALGFLRYNVQPASIFMGDTGAMFLGLVLACIAVIGPLKVATTVTVLGPVLALGVPIYDVITTLLRRLLDRRPLHLGDRQHIHYRLLGRGWSESRVVLVLWIVTGTLGVVALLITVR
ncbi:MAG: glycosyltransferase family 4 protein [Candidatus Zipacnadales bacterium]